MTLLAMIGVAGGGAIAAALGGGRGARSASASAIAGLVALAVVLVLAAALPAAPVQDSGFPGAPDGALLGGHLVTGEFLRLATALWAGGAVLVGLLAWLIDGAPAAGRLTAATLAAIAAGVVGLAATDPGLATLAAAGTGLAGLVVVLGSRLDASIRAGAQEVRVALGSTVATLVAIVIAPAAIAVVIGSASLGDQSEAPTSPTAPIVGLVGLSVALAVAIRSGAMPFHLRAVRLTDVVPTSALSLLLAWAPLPLAVAGLAAIDRLVAPIDAPFEGERAIVVAIAALTLGTAALAAFIQDDLRHATCYLVIADMGLVVLGLGAVAPEAWSAVRGWLLVLAASKTALAAWAAAVETRFDTRSVTDLRGWMRRAPLLAVALVLTGLATFGLPGWIAFDARDDLAHVVAGAPVAGLLLLLGFATLPAYLRLLAIGSGPASSRVAAATPERFVWAPPPSTVPGPRGEPGAGTGGEDERGAGAGEPAEGGRAGGRAAAEAVRPQPARSLPTSPSARRVAASGLDALGALPGAFRRNRAPTVSSIVLALALLAALTSSGTLAVAGAASEAEPGVTVPFPAAIAWAADAVRRPTLRDSGSRAADVWLARHRPADA